MRKYQRAAVVVAMLSSVSFLGAGVGQANDDHDGKFKLDNKQFQKCSADTVNITGTQVADDAITNTNGAGLQFADNSEDRFVDCDQIFAIGGK